MLNTLLQDLKNGTILHPGIFTALDLDDILDHRDGDPFDSHWINCFNAIETEMSVASVSPEDLKIIEEIRKEAFLSVSRATEQHEIASYVSDDFDLIAKSLLVNSGNEFAQKLLHSYRSGKVPQ